MGAEEGRDDEMDPEDLAALEAALEESEREFAEGKGEDLFETIAELRAESSSRVRTRS